LTGSRYVAGSGGRSGVLPSIMSPTAAMVTEAAAAPVLPGGAGTDGLAVAGSAGAAELAMAGVRPEAVMCAAGGAVSEQAVRLIAPAAPATAVGVRRFTGTSWRLAGPMASIHAVVDGRQGDLTPCHS
jgi:hypothetical protein